MDYICILRHNFHYSCIKDFRKGRRKMAGRRHWKLPTSSKDETQLLTESCTPRIYAGTKICDSHFYPALMGRRQSRPLFAIFAIFRFIDLETNPISQTPFVLNAPADSRNRELENITDLLGYRRIGLPLWLLLKLNQDYERIITFTCDIILTRLQSQFK